MRLENKNHTQKMQGQKMLRLFKHLALISCSGILAFSIEAKEFTNKSTTSKELAKTENSPNTEHKSEKMTLKKLLGEKFIEKETWSSLNTDFTKLLESGAIEEDESKALVTLHHTVRGKEYLRNHVIPVEKEQEVVKEQEVAKEQAVEDAQKEAKQKSQSFFFKEKTEPFEIDSIQIIKQDSKLTDNKGRSPSVDKVNNRKSLLQTKKDENPASKIDSKDNGSEKKTFLKKLFSK